MSLYKDDIIQHLHDKIGEGYNVRHALAMTIEHFGQRILTWAQVVVEREVKNDEDPRCVEQDG